MEVFSWRFGTLVLAAALSLLAAVFEPANQEARLSRGGASSHLSVIVQYNEVRPNKGHKHLKCWFGFGAYFVIFYIYSIKCAENIIPPLIYGSPEA